jgi:hypothetical protein
MTVALVEGSIHRIGQQALLPVSAAAAIAWREGFVVMLKKLLPHA